MLTATECRKLAEQYQGQARKAAVSPKMANVLQAMAASFETLASQYELLFAIAHEENRRRSH